MAAKIEIFKEQLYKNLIAVHQLALKPLQGIVEVFKQLQIGITMKDIQQIRGRDYANIKTRFLKSYEAEMKTYGRSQLLREHLSALIEQKFEAFKAEAEVALKRFEDSRFFAGETFTEVAVENFSLDEGEIKFSDFDKERIKANFCTISINTPEKEEFYKLLFQGHEILSRLKEIIVANNICPLFSIPGEIGIYDESREDVLVSGLEYVEFIKSE